MSLHDNLIPFIEKLPPENIDLFVSDCNEEREDRTYGILRFFRKGTPIIENHYCPPPKGLGAEDRLLHAIFGGIDISRPAPKTGYYFLEPVNENDCKWMLSCINPLDSKYVVINPEEEQ